MDVAMTLTVFLLGAFLAGLIVWSFQRSRVAVLRSHLAQKEEEAKRLHEERQKWETAYQAQVERLREVESQSSRLAADKEGIERQVEELRHLLREAHDQVQLKDQALQAHIASLSTAQTKLEEREAALRSVQEEVERLRRQVEALTSNLHKLAEERGTFQAQAESLQKLLTDRDQILKQMKQEFENLSHTLLSHQADRLTQSSRESLENLLQPFREQIQRFEEEVRQTRGEHLQSVSKLEGFIKSISEQSQIVAKQAEQLAAALKGDVRTQGEWGEFTLERLFEETGLVKDTDYKLQVIHRGEEGNRLRPDAIIYLPEKKHIVIDAKVSLKDYVEYFDAAPEDKERRLRAHVGSLRRHIQTLGDRDYQSLSEVQSADFVLMYVPLEGALQLALDYDRSLLDEARKHKVVLATPLTLIPTLRMVAYLRRQERQNQNAQRIAEEAGKLYDKLSAFMDEYKKLGDQLGRIQQQYEDSKKKLTGKGGALVIAERFKKMGARTQKSLPEPILREIDQDELHLLGPIEEGV